MEAGNPLLDEYVLALARRRRERPRVCFLPTASGDADHYVVRFYRAFDAGRCEPSHVSLFRRDRGARDLREHLLAQDLIYVGGGSVVNLLALWHEHGIGEIMRTAHEREIVLCGYSAGSMCWFEQGISRGAGAPALARGLGLLAGSHCVHYSEDPPRRDAYRRLIGSGELLGGLALDDHAAALMRDGELVEVVRSRESATGYRITADGAGGAREERLAARLLPAATHPGEELGLAEMRERRRVGARRAMRPGRIGHSR